MGDTEFSTERLLEQASGNQSALFLTMLRWASERDGSVDAWANFIGEQFADSWESMKEAPARDVAQVVGLNFASSADSRFVGLEGDDARAEAVIEGPDPEWLTEAGVTLEDNDRANELIFRKIVEHLGLTLEVRRDGDQLHFILSKP
jgi:hypothetical protein